MCRYLIMLYLLVFSFCPADGQDGNGEEIPAGRVVLPFTDAERLINTQLYRPSENYDMIFTDGIWHEIKGEWTRLTSSSGAHIYREIKFLPRSKYTMEEGMSKQIREPRKGKNHRKTTGKYRFDRDNLLLSLSGGHSRGTFGVEYFTAEEGEETNYREILVLKAPGGTVGAVTYVR